MIKISIINLKGGVGKSVTACNLAAELAHMGNNVLVVDLDKQGNTSKFFGVLDYDRPTVADVLLGDKSAAVAIEENTGIPAVHLLPCNMRMLKANQQILMDTMEPQQIRLRQYRALKQALERKKKAGTLDGRVRDEMSRITGDGTGTLGRLNAILNHCTPEVIGLVERGKITLTRAYECSKLYKIQQMEYAKTGYSALPQLDDMSRRAAVKYLVECGLADQLKKLDYVRKSEWNYADYGLDTRKMEPVKLDLTESETDALLLLKPLDSRGVRVQRLDPADPDEVLAESDIYPKDLFDSARRHYINKADLEKFKAESAKKKDLEQARRDDTEKWLMMARQELANYDNWKLVARHKDLGLTIRERKMSDGGRLIIAVDDMARYTDGQVTGFPYRDCFSVRIGPNGERVGRDGSVTTPDWMKRWYSTGGSIECYIAEDLKKIGR